LNTQTLDLGGLGGASLVFTKISDRESHEPHYFALRSCNRVEPTPERRRLIEVASGDENLFLTVRCLFDHNQRVHVGTELSDMSLADIVDCSIPVNEIHLSAILAQVSSRARHVPIANMPRLSEPVIIFIPVVQTWEGLWCTGAWRPLMSSYSGMGQSDLVGLCLSMPIMSRLTCYSSTIWNQGTPRRTHRGKSPQGSVGLGESGNPRYIRQPR
jgi:hypothetical protein